MSEGKPHKNPGNSREIFIIFVILIFVLYCGIKSEVYVDDVFITLKYARNLAEGNGMVFNAGEKVMGITSPLWCWLNAVGFVFFPAERFGALGCRLLSFISIFGAALGFYRLGRKMGWGCAGLIGAIGICLLPDHIPLFGLEYPLGIWLALEILLAFSKGQKKLMGILGGLIILTRPEAAVFVVLVFLFEYMQSRKIREIFTMAAYLLIPLAPALLFLTVYYGSPIPNTLNAKHAQLEDHGLFWLCSVGLGAWRYFIVEFLRQKTLEVYLFLTGAVWFVIELIRNRDFRKTRRGFVCALVFSWAILHVIALEILGVAFYRWYLYPVWLAIFFGITAGTGVIKVFIERNRGALTSISTAIVSAIFLLVIISWQSHWTNNISPWQKARHDGYKKIAERLNEDSRGKAAELLCHDIGVLGFYVTGNIKTIDEFFLIQKIPKRPDGRFPNRIELAFQYRPEYLVESHPMYEGMTEGIRAFQNKRLEEDYKETFTAQNGERITYIPILKIKSEYGIQVLYRMERISEPNQ